MRKAKINQTVKMMYDYAIALGIVFGAAIGSSVAILSNYNIAILTVVGAGIGVVIGAIIFSNYKKN